MVGFLLSLLRWSTGLPMEDVVRSKIVAWWVREHFQPRTEIKPVQGRGDKGPIPHQTWIGAEQMVGDESPGGMRPDSGDPQGGG